VPAPAAVGERADQFIAALGGSANLNSIDACTTRLRLSLSDPSAVDEPALRVLGARGIVRPGGDSVQVVVGPVADQLAGEMRSAVARNQPVERGELAGAIADALQRAGIRTIGRCGSRVLIGLDYPSRISAAETDRLGARGWVAVAGGVQVIIGPEAESVAQELRSSESTGS
jgi:N-acetylglucosamine PTS system EIICBA or EIICB component